MLTQRLGSETQKDPAFLAELIAAIQAHPGSCDEVWLATDYGFPSMETHRASAEALGKIAEKFRAIGVRVSLQLSNSLGHGQYMSARDCSGLVYEGSPAENMVGHRGERADYCFCWRGAHVREYVRQELSLYAAAVQPDTVWIDDDLRATNHFPVEYGCFCETCLAQFCARYGVEISREALVRAINRGEAVWRARWVEFVREGLRDFTDEMARAIHAVSPDSAIGLQGCAHGAYTGYGYDFLYSAMREATGKPPKSRPGGGAYNDHNPLAFLEKAVLLNWQNEMLPAYVREIRPEIENLPDVPYGKSIPGTILETTLYLACGANAMSYAMLMNDYEPMAWHAQMLAGFARHRPYWQALAAANEGTAQGGFRPLKNIMGLWLIQECRREWQAEGISLSWDEIVREAEAAEPFRSIIDTDHTPFFSGGHMRQKIRQFCAATNQPLPDTVSSFARCVYESLALKYRYTLERLSEIKGHAIESLNIVGGGSRNRLLNRFAADAAGCRVITGPVESAAIGNLLVQAMALGDISGIDELRDIVRRCEAVECYEPNTTAEWEAAYGRLLGYMERSGKK